MAKQTTQKQQIDAPGTTPELRKYIDEEFGKDFVIRSLGFTRAYIENAQHGGKIELPKEFRPKIAGLIEEHDAKEAAAAKEAAKATETVLTDS